jgi:hypothetical protein
MPLDATKVSADKHASATELWSHPVPPTLLTGVPDLCYAWRVALWALRFGWTEGDVMDKWRRAFGAAVVAGSKKLQDCPHLKDDDVQPFLTLLSKKNDQPALQAEFLDTLQHKTATLDFQTIAPILGCTTQGKQLNIISLGKTFAINQDGTISSECHIIPWVEAPILSYITHKNHMNITGNWISFRELRGGIDWQGLFTSRCEKPLCELADHNPELLEDLIDLFMGRETDTSKYEANIALILHPLPHIPILICYQKADTDLESILTLFFDECCGHNLHIKSIYTLCAGLVKMFEQIAQRHG